MNVLNNKIWHTATPVDNYHLSIRQLMTDDSPGHTNSSQYRRAAQYLTMVTDLMIVWDRHMVYRYSQVRRLRTDHNSVLNMLIEYRERESVYG